MRLTTTPWGRRGLDKADQARLRAALPEGYTLALNGTSAHGDWRARLWCAGITGPGPWGEVADVYSNVGAFDAAILAIRTAAGDVDNLAERLRASLVALGLEPAA